MKTFTEEEGNISMFHQINYNSHIFSNLTLKKNYVLILFLFHCHISKQLYLRMPNYYKNNNNNNKSEFNSA